MRCKAIQINSANTKETKANPSLIIVKETHKQSLRHTNNPFFPLINISRARKAPPFNFQPSTTSIAFSAHFFLISSSGLTRSACGNEGTALDHSSAKQRSIINDMRTLSSLEVFSRFLRTHAFINAYLGAEDHGDCAVAEGLAAGALP